MRALLFLALLPACVEPIACDTMAVSSVRVSLIAEDGGDLSAATVSYLPEGGDWTPCDLFDGSWTCGYEAAGLLTIRAEAEGYDSIEQEVEVTQGECHVVTESVSLTMVPETVDCTDEEVPSVLATVVGSSGEELSGVVVAWGYTNAEMEPVACEERGEDVWACGAEIAGELEVTATADGHVGEVQVVTVEADECHVITEAITFELDWAAD